MHLRVEAMPWVLLSVGTHHSEIKLAIRICIGNRAGKMKSLALCRAVVGAAAHILAFTDHPTFVLSTRSLVTNGSHILRRDPGSDRPFSPHNMPK